MKRRRVDRRRRIVMPVECPARSAVTIQQLDSDTWVIRRQVPGRKLQTTLPLDIVQAAGLGVSAQIEWRFEDGEIRGRKLVLTKVKAGAPEPFPKGSLLQEITPERNAEQLAILAACARVPTKPQRKTNRGLTV